MKGLWNNETFWAVVFISLAVIVVAIDRHNKANEHREAVSVEVAQ